MGPNVRTRADARQEIRTSAAHWSSCGTRLHAAWSSSKRLSSQPDADSDEEEASPAGQGLPARVDSGWSHTGTGQWRLLTLQRAGAHPEPSGGNAQTSPQQASRQEECWLCFDQQAHQPCRAIALARCTSARCAALAARRAPWCHAAPPRTEAAAARSSGLSAPPPTMADSSGRAPASARPH